MHNQEASASGQEALTSSDAHWGSLAACFGSSPGLKDKGLASPAVCNGRSDAGGYFSSTCTHFSQAYPYAAL